MTSPAQPSQRLRRLRADPALRALVRETDAPGPARLVAPLFVCEGTALRRPIASMPGVAQLSVDELVRECRELHSLGVPAVLLFGIPAHKDATGTQGYAENGIIPRALRALRAEVPGLLLWADVCLCEYTDHGHCGVLHGDGPATTVNNDATLPLLAAEAVAYARAGAHVVAPSAMMDGQVAAIRAALDAAGFTDTILCAYAAKYASAFYGPFREAAQSAPQFGDRRSYQMDPANAREALREIDADISQGADIVMVKPALAYLDIIRAARDRFDLPIAAYNVSGEYSMVKAAAAAGWLDEARVRDEILLAIRRAGADILITYFARDIAAAAAKSARP